jgi:hypothetical protein
VSIRISKRNLAASLVENFFLLFMQSFLVTLGGLEQGLPVALAGPSNSSGNGAPGTGRTSDRQTQPAPEPRLAIIWISLCSSTLAYHLWICIERDFLDEGIHTSWETFTTLALLLWRGRAILIFFLAGLEKLLKLTSKLWVQHLEWAAIYAAGRMERERARASIAKVRASDEKRNEPPPDSDSPPSPVKPYEEMICAAAWHRSTVD